MKKQKNNQNKTNPAYWNWYTETELIEAGVTVASHPHASELFVLTQDIESWSRSENHRI